MGGRKQRLGNPRQAAKKQEQGDMSEKDEILYAAKHLTQFPKSLMETPVGTLFSNGWQSARTGPVGGWDIDPAHWKWRKQHKSSFRSVVLAEVEEYRISSLDRFLPMYSVWEATAHMVGRVQLSVIKFYFFRYGAGQRVVPVQVIARGPEGDLEVVVRFDNAWQSMAAFLDSFNMAEHYFGTPMPTIGEQQLWWSQNRRFFPFMKLPTEIRLKIYKEAFGPAVVPFRYWRDKRPKRSHGFLHITHAPNLALLPVSKQVYAEASEVLQKSPVFGLGSGLHLLRFLRKIGPNATSHLRKLELSFTHADYLRYFGARLTTTSRDRCCKSVRMLRLLPLSELTIYMPPANNMTDTPFLPCCQKFVSAWILMFAWDHVKYSPVKLTGFYKISQREAFMADLQDFQARLAIKSASNPDECESGASNNTDTEPEFTRGHLWRDTEVLRKKFRNFSQVRT